MSEAIQKTQLQKTLNVLIVEDESDIREIIQSVLEDEGFKVTTSDNGADIIQKLQSSQAKILVLDQLMPHILGSDVIKIIRAHEDYRKFPILMLSALTSENDKVAALELGADDYVTKPFQPRELAARLRALDRRATAESAEKKIKLMKYEGLNIDFISHRVLMKEIELQLTLTEFKILVELLKTADQVLSRELLRERALGNLNVSDRTIDVHMAALRKKLGDIGDQIQTVRGVGYRFSGRPEVQYIA